MAEFPFNTPVTIKAWTSNPNGVTDNDFTDDTLTATVSSLIQGVVVNISPGDTTFCAGFPITLDAGAQPAGAIYVWDNGALTQTISVGQSGVYSVKVQSAGGCMDEDTVTITELPQPVASLLAVVDNGNNTYTFSIVGAQNIDTYAWDFGDGSTDSGPGPKVHTYTNPGLYAATVTLSNSCNELYLTDQIQIENEGTGISDAGSLEASVGLYPNPARDQVSIRTSGLKMLHISVYNVVGQRVYESVVSGALTVLDTRSFANGVYQLVIDTDHGQAVKKLEIVK
jgi:PKD repeat protein